MENRAPHVAIICLALSALRCSGRLAAEAADPSAQLGGGFDADAASAVTLDAFATTGAPDATAVVDSADSLDSSGAVDADGGDAHEGASESSEAAADSGSCANAWIQADPGCPSPDNLSAFGALCPSLGIRCLLHMDDPATYYIAEECEFPSDAIGPLWTWHAPVYEPSDFAALPNEVLLDASDCASRPVTACHCTIEDEAEVEGLLNSDSTLWEATYGNPTAFVAFTDEGCAAEVRFGNETPATPDFAAGLTAIYAARRWDCASSGTHFVMIHTVRPIGAQ
ncbi:MAG TPA: hypothetical protein VGM06_08315 [Polyangiaceae bacterium]|jgi:hypothetical protein